MKKTLYLFLLVTITYSCDTEEAFDFEEIIESEQIIDSGKAIELSNTIDSKQSSLTTKSSDAVLDFQSHKDMLAWNSFIVGEVMRLSPPDKSYVIEAIDPESKTVLMSTLFNQNSTFYDHYIFIATHAIINYDPCSLPIITEKSGPIEDPLWPPFDPLEPFSTPIDSIPDIVYTLIDNITYNNTELYQPSNNTSEDIHTVGHPLVNITNHIGTIIYNPPLEGTIDNEDCLTYSNPSNVNSENQINEDFIILSRPNLSNGNPYPYIDFDIKIYLQNTNN